MSQMSYIPRLRTSAPEGNTAMKRIGLVVFPGFQILDMVAVTVFEVAHTLGKTPAYEVELLYEHGGSVGSSSGVAVETKRFGKTKFDTIMVGGWIAPISPSQALLDFLNAASKTSRR